MDCHVVGGMVREVEMARDWLRDIFLIFLNVAKLFAKTVCKFSACSFKVDFFAQSAGYVLDEITGDACKSIIDFDGLLRT